MTAGAESIQEYLQRGGNRYRAALVTLTYRPGVAWEPRHISKLIDHYRGWLRRRGGEFRAVWVMELQRRGAPHYHLLMFLPRGLTPPLPDKQGWWPHGATNAQWARRPLQYLTKYASKGIAPGASPPHGARLFGIYGCPRHLGYWRAPAWMREIAEPGWTVRYRKGGWWCVEQLAHAWRSPWMLRDIVHDELLIEWKGWLPSDIRPLWELGF